MRIIGVIPARLESTRLPRKALLEINNKPMLQYVWEQSIKSNLDEVIIATDSSEIYSTAIGFGANAVMTSKNHLNGTSRLIEVSSNYPADLYINIQGDEPLISPNLINQLGSEWVRNSDRNVITAANPNCSEIEYHSPNVVKVVTDRNNDALYFSRAPIPFIRERDHVSAKKHIGIYGYTPLGLEVYQSSVRGALEITESLEQLRFLECGEKIKVILTEYESIGVDTLEDLIKVREIINRV
jgi:3-deoxy-manno-octulosonate cytidylyltransferase (CMP-KDO synthetase)